MIIQIIDPRKGIFVLNGSLVDRTVILDQTVRSVLLLHKERRCSPSRGTWTNETLAKRFVDFLLKLKEFVRRHLVGSFGDRNGAWFQVDDELDSPGRGYSWKFFWKYVLEVANDWNLFNSLKRCRVQRIQSIKSCFSVLNKLSMVGYNLI